MQVAPEHLAFIMDGNRRWAVLNGLPIEKGYERGREVMLDAVTESEKRGVKCVSVFAFSTENFSRAKREVDAVMQVVFDFCQTVADDAHSKNWRIRFSGDRSMLDNTLVKYIDKVELKTASNCGITLNIALAYGSQNDIIKAANAATNNLTLDKDAFEKGLSSYGLPKLEMLLRTGGEKRLSNFMLYEAAYAELFFLDKPWCDFTLEDLDEALNDFAARKRNFGR